ncbi:hypothetical protein VNO78_27167 [Psophocarpus tetragonolobus]|uniref:Uncharacterized protein n=1 Tax=Psophocarpus tetragonolobus TaxID=3891 RepID=A0AAN9S0A9_PSOTE
MKVMKHPSKPWRPLTTNCCTIEDQTIFNDLSRCKPSSSAISNDIAQLPSLFHWLSFSDLSHFSSIASNEDLAQSFATNLYDFQLSEMRAITQNFSSNFLLGEGGFGAVHKGYIDANLKKGLKAQPVAVKILNVEGLQGHREWLDFTAKLSDFGLAKMLPEGTKSHVTTTRVWGTYGYAAPEYISTVQNMAVNYGHWTQCAGNRASNKVKIDLRAGANHKNLSHLVSN